MLEPRKSASLNLLLKGLCAEVAGRELSPSELSVYQVRKVSCGVTRLIRCPDGIDRHLDLLITVSFPNTLPLVAIRDPSLYLVWPHVESDGVMCLPSAGKSFNDDDMLRQALGVFREALELVQNMASEPWITVEFRKEFVTYWGHHARHIAHAIKAKISPVKQSCMLPYTTIGEEIYISDTDASLREFVQRMKGPVIHKLVIRNALLVKLPDAPIPSDMPTTAKEAENIILRYAAELKQELGTYLKSNSDLLMLVQVPLEKNISYGGLWIPKNPPPTLRRKSRHNLNGFRLGREPENLLWNQFFSPSKLLTYLSLDRFDDVVVRSRADQLPRSNSLDAYHVALVGCGSVGSSIASILAQSGVGHLTLVDPDVLVSGNLSRHELGAPSVGNPKAVDLAQRLKRDRPQLQSVTPIVKHVEKLSEKHWEQVMEADLVLFAIGQTGLENYAADVLWKKEFTGVIGHAWLEPFASVGHLLTCVKNGVSRRQLTGSLGDPLEPVTCWDDVDVERKGGECGGSFQPYGAAALGRSVAMMSARIIDILLDPPAITSEMIITGTTAEVERHGGAWSVNWLAKTSGKVSGRQFTRSHKVSLALVSGE